MSTLVRMPALQKLYLNVGAPARCLLV